MFVNPQTAIQAAINLIGLRALAAVAGVSYQAVQHWAHRGRLPRTEYSGETHYAELITAACREKDPQTQITREALLGAHPGRALELERASA